MLAFVFVQILEALVIGAVRLVVVFSTSGYLVSRIFLKYLTMKELSVVWLHHSSSTF